MTDVGLRLKQETKIIPRFGPLFPRESWWFSRKKKREPRRTKRFGENSVYNSCHCKSSNQGGMVGVWAPILAKVMDENVRECLERRGDDQRLSCRASKR